MFFSSLKEYEGMKPGLAGIKKFLEAVGDPQNNFKSIHIAGTNGKGSAAVLIANALKESGYKTALYTSPHLVDITERIKIGGKSISKRTFKKISEKYLPLAQKCKLSYFEYLTAIAFMYFSCRKVDIAVIETGLGGRFDATNIIKNPAVCIITSIALDHQEILGSTVAGIAFEKAGIIKNGADVICGSLPAAALNIIKKKSKPLVFGRDFIIENIRSDCAKRSQSFDYISSGKKIKNIKLSLLGKHQAQNAAAAACCIEVLNRKGFDVSGKVLKQSFFKTKWPGRFDFRKVVLKDKSFDLIIDGAHNAQGMDSFIETLKSCHKQKIALLFAVMKEKDYKKIIKKINPHVSKVILVRLQNGRAVEAGKIEREFAKYKLKEKVFKADSVAEAFGMISNGETAAVAGSLYLAGEVLKNIN
ncbi:MAG: Mur ligase family protein [Endomicrobia bacterium]|nr:Mur ligase family protein [Endomicrobiia bacterium]